MATVRDMEDGVNIEKPKKTVSTGTVAGGHN
jgi:hypothetical protein